MFSETKSFTSLAIGMLIEEKKIGLQDPICQYFPEFLPGRVHPWMAEMTVEHLLMMETCHNMTTYDKTSTTKNWVESFFVSIPTHRPGTIFQYDTSASHTLCALVEKVTGQKLLDFLKQRVLREIGFSEESYVMADPFGVSMGGTGLMAKPMDMLRVGLMLLNHGKHPDDYGKADGRQVYPKEYLQQALSFQTSTALSSSMDFGYGYQFWMLPHGGYAMLGMGSQDVFCFPEQDMVIVCTADTQGIPDGNSMILHAIDAELFHKLSDNPIKEDEEARGEQMKLAETVEHLELPVLEKGRKKRGQRQVIGRDFFLDSNGQGLKRIRVIMEPEGEKGYLEYENRRGIHRIAFGMGHSEECQFPEYCQRCIASAQWCDENTLYIRVWLIDESVAAVHMKLAFTEAGGITVLMKKTEETRFCEFNGMLTGKA